MREQVKDKNRSVRECLIRTSGEVGDRKFTLSFASEEPYQRWFGLEILEHSENSIDLTRIAEIGCVLWNHRRDDVIGKINRIWIENKRSHAEIEFDDDDLSEKIYKKVKNGTLKGVSVGYTVSVWEEVEVNKKSTDGRFMGPCSIAKRWEPFEISIVSVPADATVGVGRELGTEVRSLIDLCERQLQINKNKQVEGM
jgi:Caudovirus prohead protease.